MRLKKPNEANQGKVKVKVKDMDTHERIKKLRAKLLYHAKRYYVDDDPEISDYDYDIPNFLIPPLLRNA